MAKENITVYLILGLLSHEDMSGYDIKKRIDTIVSNFWNAGYGQIYPSLKQLENDKLVSKHLADDSKGPEKHLYSITGSGKKALTSWLRTFTEKETLRLEVLVKLFFGNTISLDDNKRRIGEFRERSAASLNQMKAYKKSLQKALHESDDHQYYYFTVLFGEHVYAAYQKWADEVLDLMNGMKG